MISVVIKENSWLAKIAAKKMKAHSIAMVVGNTIHLHNTTQKDFLSNRQWLRHEIAHVKQYQRVGIIPFLFSYLLESFNKGYLNNKFEVEARQMERDLRILDGVEIKQPIQSKTRGKLGVQD